MRMHEVKCSIEGDKNNKNIQNTINHFAISYIQNVIQESGLSKPEQLKLIEELLKKIQLTGQL